MATEQRSFATPTQVQLYARDTDGSLPCTVVVVEGSSGAPETSKVSYHLHTPSGATKVFSSKRQLLIALTGHPKARNWTFDRYFRLTPEPTVARPALTTLELFGVLELSPLRAAVTKAQAHSLAKAVALGAPKASTLNAKGLGIDLINRSGEVAKLLFAGFGKWIYSCGYDPQEVLQEVFMGILVRNQGKCPWDKTKSSFGHYVHLVCNGVVSNYHRKQKRVRECESTGIRGLDNEVVDVASSNLPAPPEGVVEQQGVMDAMEDLLTYMPEQSSTYLARKVLPLLRDGYSRTDIARTLGVNRALVTSAITELQGWATQWAKEQSK